MGTEIGKNLKLSCGNVYLTVNKKEMLEQVYKGFTIEGQFFVHISMTQEDFDKMVMDYIKFKLTGELPE